MRKVSKEVNKENNVPIYIILIIGAILGFAFGSLFIKTEYVLLNVFMLAIWSMGGAITTLYGIYLIIQVIEEIKTNKKKKCKN